MNDEKINVNTVNQTEPSSEDVKKISWLTENLLKNPLKVVEGFQKESPRGFLFNILFINIICLLAYGVIVGSFSGGIQWYMSPVKIIMGLILTIIFCYPSFYIFLCLGGVDIKPGNAFLLLLSSITVFSILMVGFVPVAWVFSESTTTLFFIGFFHILFWLVSTLFGMRVLVKTALSLKCKNILYPVFWILIFLITSLQMMTALRPIIGTSDSILPKEKMFFMYHWVKLLSETIDKSEK